MSQDTSEYMDWDNTQYILDSPSDNHQLIYQWQFFIIWT